MRADRDVQEFRNRHLNEQERVVKAKREQTRLLKYIVKNILQSFVMIKIDIYFSCSLLESTEIKR
jgi:hypothetical protein